MLCCWLLIAAQSSERNNEAMVKITFQSVAGQKVEKDESDGDKTEVLIPHQTVSE